MNKFSLRGSVVGYGVTKGKEWIDLSTPDGDITVYLEDLYLKDIVDGKLDNTYLEVSGYLKSYTYMDEVLAIATKVEVL